MSLSDIERLLNESIGLDAASIGVSAIERAVQARLAACQLPSVRDYWELVRGSNDELQALIEAVVVPETWFFRDADALAAATRFVRDSCLVSDKSRVRLMSLPCATGEEPYSMAMALLDGGIAAHRFQIDAVDISAHALEEAQRGIYRRSSFRGDTPHYRARHFAATSNGFCILDHVQRQVRFHHGNVLVPETLPGMGSYDVVFCRNVLIYFDREAQTRALAVLSRLLTPTGLLFVGPAESGVLLSHGFVSARMPRAHAFRIVRDAAPQEHKKPKPVAQSRPARPASARVERPTARKPAAPAPLSPVPRPNPDASVDRGLDEVIRLGNENRFAEGAQKCEEYLRKHGPSAQAFYLLGLMRDAAGHEVDATMCYRKALYLDPHHHDALVHLALLMETANDAPEAHRLRARARRAAREEGRAS